MMSKILLLLVFAACASARTHEGLDKFGLKHGHLYRTLSIKGFGKLNVTYGFPLPDALRVIDKQRVLDAHNVLRLKLGRGDELKGWNGNNARPAYKKMPSAANMEVMEWDDQLAKYAQEWADTCKTGHSPLTRSKMPTYSEADLGENLSGDITFMERDMYDEVHSWNFDIFRCQNGKQCGHYLKVAGWGFNRVGCGWKVCVNSKTDKTLTMVCVYGGTQMTAKEKGKKRLPIQHEYLAGPPCSACQQGWDFCMGGGLCATKKQCDADSKNECKCLHDKATCEGNGGTFNSAECSCKCPATKMGINCAIPCKNLYDEPCGMTCGKTSTEAYFCQKVCNGCGVSKSPAYRYWFETHRAGNKDNVKPRHYFKNPCKNMPKVDMTTLQDYGKCKNIAGNDDICNCLKRRDYCKDTSLFGSSVRYYCALSCSNCDKMLAEKKKKEAESAKWGFGKLSNSDIESVLKNLKIAEAKDKGKKKKEDGLADIWGGSAGLNKIEGLGDLDLSGFKIVG